MILCAYFLCALFAPFSIRLQTVSRHSASEPHERLLGEVETLCGGQFVVPHCLIQVHSNAKYTDRDLITITYLFIR
jgi:hypothetical protein